jgi:hypothetical protein
MRESRFVGKSLALAVALAAFLWMAGAAQGAGEDVAAKVGGKVITLEEVDQRGLGSNLKAYQGLYDVRKKVLDEMIGDMLIEKEAKARGVSKQRLIQSEIVAKTKAVTDEEIQSWYDANQARVRNQPLDKLRPRISSFLASERSMAARKAFVDSLKAKASVQIKLDPPRIPVKVAATDASMGPANAPVLLVEYSDFQ